MWSACCAWSVRIPSGSSGNDRTATSYEINTAFTDILGYGPENLPYPSMHPWWPDADTDPEAHRQVADAFAGLLDQNKGSYTIARHTPRRAPPVDQRHLQSGPGS
ncbi:hypothetical protein SMICM17S_02327 [Streptomyces microflavus]